MTPPPSRQSFALDYVDVATRIQEFRTKHPDGALQQVSLDFREFGGTSWVIYTAAAYRSPEDACPGHGTAWEQVPGATNFTRGSEVQNAETAAWGRAIIAALAGDSKRIASAEEVRASQDRQATPWAGSGAAADAEMAREQARLDLLSAVTAAALAAGVPLAEIEADWAAAHNGQFIGDATDIGSLELLRDDLKARKP